MQPVARLACRECSSYRCFTSHSWSFENLVRQQKSWHKACLVEDTTATVRWLFQLHLCSDSQCFSDIKPSDTRKDSIFTGVPRQIVKLETYITFLCNHITEQKPQAATGTSLWCWPISFSIDHTEQELDLLLLMSPSDRHRDPQIPPSRVRYPAR